MTPSYDDELPGRGYPRRTDPETGDHEISLGTPTILGIFFALALVCAGFFGFGYTLGRRSVQSAPATLTADPLPNSAAPKPAAGSAAAQAIPSTTPAQTAVVSLNPASTPALTPAVSQQPAATAPQPVASNPQAATSFMVQVAAVSSQDVADILTSSLQKKGYTVAVHHEPQDKLLHVQIGPFTDRKEAETMQKRVLADGFNAIVK
jgi:DedD protein